MVIRKGQNDVLWALGELFFFFSLCFLILINLLLYTQVMIYEIHTWVSPYNLLISNGTSMPVPLLIFNN